MTAAVSNKARQAQHAPALSYADAIDKVSRTLSIAAALRNGWHRLRDDASLKRYRDARASWREATRQLAMARPACNGAAASAVRNPIARALASRPGANDNRSHLASRPGANDNRSHLAGPAYCERESFALRNLLAGQPIATGQRHDRATIKRRAERAKLEARLAGWNRDRWRAASVYAARVESARPKPERMTGPNNPDRETWRTVKRAPALALEWATDHRLSTRSVMAVPLPSPTDKQRQRASNASGVPMVVIPHGHTARHRVILPDLDDAAHRARRLTRREKKSIKR